MGRLSLASASEVTCELTHSKDCPSTRAYPAWTLDLRFDAGLWLQLL